MSTISHEEWAQKLLNAIVELIKMEAELLGRPSLIVEHQETNMIILSN